MKKRLLGFCFLLALQTLIAQDFSNRGKDFFIVYPDHIDGYTTRMGIYITSDVNATGNIQVGSVNVPFTVTANQITKKFIGNGGDAPNTSIMLRQDEQTVPNGAMRVTSDRDVVVYAHIINNARSGAMLVLPTKVWGKDYIVPSYRNTGNSQSFGGLSVVASQPNTIVEITPKITSKNGARIAGTPYTVNLNQYDTYFIQFAQNADMSGTTVKSISNTGACKPIAVFSSTTWTGMDCNAASGGDNLLQQIFPVGTWGKQFFTAPFFGKSYDIIRVFIKTPGTVVSKTENGNTVFLTGLQAGSYYEIKTANPTFIEGDNPISVVQYITSQNCSSPLINSDPEMVVLNPVEQTINNITVFSAIASAISPAQSNVNRSFLNIIMKTTGTASFKINGNPPPGTWQTILGSEYSYLRSEVTSIAQSDPVHTLKADSNFSAIAYGYGNVESYGYNAGTNVRDLYQFVTIANQFATVNFPATCRNTPFRFSLTLPYQPTNMVWQFNNNPNLSPNADVPITNPMPDSTFVRDGRTLYVYRLQTNYSFATTGTYPVKVTVTLPPGQVSECGGATQDIDYDLEVFDPPPVDFTVTHSGCLTDSVRFQDISNTNGRPVIRYIWDFGDGTGLSGTNGSPAKLYTTATTVTVKDTVITDVGCVGQTSKTIALTTPPIAKFGRSNNSCKGQTMTFTDSSNIQVGTIVEWRWNIDNGAQIIVNNTNAPITYTFNTTGAHTVSLTVKSNSGCNSFAFTLPITVHPLPVVNFNLPGVCLPSGFAQFYDSTTIADNTPLASYFWDFGDGSTSTLRNPTHNFASAGPFTIKHIVTSNNGCIDSATKVLNTIYQQPVAQFSAANELCERQSFNFTDQSTVQGSTVNQWYWSFGDGSTSTQQNNIKLYATPQTYTVKLLVKSVQGCPSDTLTRTVTLNPLPLATFNIDAPNCETRNSVFNNTSTMNVGTLAAAWWNYGDASTGNSTAASHPHTYANIGPYVVRLAVQNSKGCNSDTVSRNITISNLPRPNFILPEVCLSDSYAEFLDSTWIPNGNGPFTYSWNFGDPINSTPPNPNTSTQQNPRHRYSAVGQYNVKLVATSPTGCQDSLTKVITVNGAIPLANFTVNNPTALCSNLPISIVNTSTVDFGNITKVTVDFDAASPLSIDTTDETPSPGSVYTFKYPDFQSPLTRTFTISFKAFSGGTCVNERRINVTVNASPKVRFSTVPGICLDASPRQMVQAVETGNVPGTGVFTGTGVSNTGLFTPSSTTPGTYTIKYLYTSNQGCKDSASNTITVWPSPTANFLFSSPSCEQRDITFTDLSVPNYSNISQWQWDFGDGTTQNRTSAAPFAKRFAAVGTYTVRLRVVTDSGCRSNPLPTDVSVNPIPVVDFVMPQICLPSGTGTFVDSSTISDGTQAQFTYRWDFGDGSIGVGRTPTHRYTSTGPFNVTLRVTSNRGCDTTRTKVFNNILPQPTAQFDVDSVGVCLGGQFTFTDRSNGRTSTIREWNWNYDDGNGIDIRTNPNPFTKRLNIARTYNVSLFFFNQQGCVSDTFVLPVTVHPFPVVDAGPDQFVLEGGTAIFEPVATGNELRYRWTPPIYLINGTDSIAKAVCRPDNDQYYLLTVTGRGGCADTSGLFVKVLRAPKIPNAFSPNGDGVNDTWVIELLDTYPGCEIDVFNRYGQVVYHAIGYKRPWDGKMNGKDDLPVGTYYYVIQPKNKRPPIKGSVTILR